MWGVPVAAWCSECIFRMRGGLLSHILMIPAALSLPPWRGAASGREPTILQNEWFLHQNLQFWRVFSFTSYLYSEAIVCMKVQYSWRMLGMEGLFQIVRIISKHVTILVFDSAKPDAGNHKVTRHAAKNLKQALHSEHSWMIVNFHTNNRVTIRKILRPTL